MVAVHPKSLECVYQLHGDGAQGDFRSEGCGHPSLESRQVVRQHVSTTVEYVVCKLPNACHQAIRRHNIHLQRLRLRTCCSVFMLRTGQNGALAIILHARQPSALWFTCHSYLVSSLWSECCTLVDTVIRGFVQSRYYTQSVIPHSAVGHLMIKRTTGTVSVGDGTPGCSGVGLGTPVGVRYLLQLMVDRMRHAELSTRRAPRAGPFLRRVGATWPYGCQVGDIPATPATGRLRTCDGPNVRPVATKLEMKQRHISTCGQEHPTPIVPQPRHVANHSVPQWMDRISAVCTPLQPSSTRARGKALACHRSATLARHRNATGTSWAGASQREAAASIALGSCCQSIGDAAERCCNATIPSALHTAA